MKPTELQHYQEKVHSNLELNRQEIEQGRSFLQSTPSFIKIDLMGACNMRPYCCMCDFDEENPLRHRGLDITELRACEELLDTAERIWDGSTGEALLHPCFAELIAEWSRKGKRVGFTTAGLALTPRITELLSPSFESLSVTVSLDAGTASTFSRLRGNCFDEIIANVKYFVRRRRECAPARHDGIGLSFIPMRTNRHEIPLLFELARDLGANFVVLRPLHRRPVNKVVARNGYVFDYGRETLSEVELEECRQAAVAASAANGVGLVCEYEVSGPNRYEEYQPRGLDHTQPACLIPWRFAKLIHDGQTFPCVYITESMGDWRRDGLAAVWNNSKWVRLREQLATGAPADLCYRAPSCTVARRLTNRRRDAEISDLLQRSRAADGVYRFNLCDKASYFLIDEGVYEPDGSAGEGFEFRWLGAEASWRLPNPFPGKAAWLSMSVRTHKPDVESNPLHLRISVDGSDGKVVTLVTTDGTPVTMRIPASSSSMLQMRTSAVNPWVPKEHPALCRPADARRLSVQVREVILSAKELEQCSQYVLLERPPRAARLRWRDCTDARGGQCMFPWRFAGKQQGGIECVRVATGEPAPDEECSGVLANDSKWDGLRNEIACSPMAEWFFKARTCPILKHIAGQQEELATLISAGRLDSGAYRFRLSDPRYSFLLEEGFYEPDGSAGANREFRWLGREAHWRVPNPFRGHAGWLVVVFRTFRPDFTGEPSRIRLSLDGGLEQELAVFSGAPHHACLHLAASDASSYRVSVLAENPWTPKDYPECRNQDDLRILSVQMGDNLLGQSLRSLLPHIVRAR